jgi:lipopolysaccharide/colanic/teichoic acid biosynthesis glycosyltransferase
VALYPEQTRDLVLSVRPGITDPASLEFFDESAILRDSADPEVAYVTQVLPVKLALYEKYVRDRSLYTDFRIVCATVWRIFEAALRRLHRGKKVMSSAGVD